MITYLGGSANIILNSLVCPNRTAKLRPAQTAVYMCMNAINMMYFVFHRLQMFGLVL